MFLHYTDPAYYESLVSLSKKQAWYPSSYNQSGKQYFRQRPIDEGKILKDRSMVLIWENEPVFAFLGASVKNGEKTDLLYYEIPCHFMENRSLLTKKAIKLFFREFDRLLEEIDGVVWYRDFVINGIVSNFSKYLLLSGAESSPCYTQMIDLLDKRATEKASMRKRYSSLINWGMRELNPKVYDETNISWDLMERFRELHIREAGRETRSLKSWHRQFEWIKTGGAFLVVGSMGSDMVSAGFFSVNQKHCYYGSSASRRDLFEKPLFHALMWTAILHAKKIGLQWFEVGEQLFLNHPANHHPTSKELGISEFKAGFGGNIHMHLDIRLNCSKNV